MTSQTALSRVNGPNGPRASRPTKSQARFIFAVANRLDDVLSQFPTPPRVFILRLRLVPLIDTSGVAALRHVLKRCGRQGTRVILSGLREQPRAILAQMGVRPDGVALLFAVNFVEALQLATP